MAVSIAHCNQALAEIAAPPIASIQEDSVESRECARAAPALMEELLDWTEWQWAETCLALAMVPNDRPAEWKCCYARPANCKAPIAIRQIETGPGDFPIAGPGTFPRQDAVPIPFTLSGDRIYTNVDRAVLVFTRTDIFELPSLVARAFVLELAARLCYPIKKDLKLQRLLLERAALAKVEAMADEQNKSPRRGPQYISDAEYARAGIMDGF